MQKRNVIPGGEFAARSKFAKTDPTKTPVEKKVVRLFGELEIAELNFIAGREFGLAVIELRNEIKKNGKRNFMTRLKQLGIPYAKARYWMAIVESKPIHRGKAKHTTKEKHGANAGDSVEAQEKPKADWREDWELVTAKFREVAQAIIVLEGAQPAGSAAFIGELEILAETLGYELKEKKKKETVHGLLQRMPPGGSSVDEGAYGGGTHRAGGSR
jgi:hypothetical protein